MTLQADSCVDRFADEGFVSIESMLDAGECDALTAKLDRASPGSAGSRALLSQAWCRELAARMRGHHILRTLLPTAHVAVQCTYFEKSMSRNWLVPVHQDLGIPVAERIDHPQLNAWSHKEGSWHVQPPPSVLQQLIAVRLHLDDCLADDGPLRVVPGSHRLGIIDDETAAAMRRNEGEVACVGARGSALLMRPLLLHASSKACGTSLRRVLHMVFGPPALPFGLRWHHAV